MKLLWLTDIHLNFLDEPARIKFYQEIVAKHGDALLISGDIAEAPSIGKMLREMCKHINKPIYFVLGNHDYYRGQISVVRKEMESLTKEEVLLHWLPIAGLQELDNDIILVGQDGWADGRLGDYNHSNVILNDSRMIAELYQQQILGKKPLLEKMQQLADNDASQLKKQLQAAIAKQPRKIIIVTHIPPFKEASFYRGKISGDNYLPFYTCKATGDVLLQMATENNAIEFLALCGHTHGEAFYQPLPNLTVKVGKSEYYYPAVQEVIDSNKK